MKTDDKYRLALAEIKKSKPDINKVKKLLEESLGKGNPMAAYALGTWYLHGKYFKRNPKVAVRLLQQASNGCVTEAMYDLAICYERGVGVNKNYKLAFKNYLKSALYGNKQSFYEVGRCYYYGIGIKKDRSIAAMWLDKAKDIRKTG